MKIKKIIMSALLAGIFGSGLGLMLSGCSGTNSSLEKAHIMNGGCFITCYNKTYDKTDTLNKVSKTASATAPAKNAAKSINNLG